MPIFLTQEPLESCGVALQIQVPEEDAARMMARVYRQFARRVQVPGFRPGKAPKRLVDRELNLERVRQTALEQLIAEAYHDALDQTEIEPFADPEFDLPEDPWDGESAIQFTARVPLPPKVELGSLEGYTARRIVTGITDADVDAEIERHRLGHTEWQDQDGPAEMGDRVLITLQANIDGELSEEASIDEPAWVQIGDNLDEVDENLIGLQADHQTEFTFTYDDDWHDESMRGKETQARVKCSGVRREATPQLDDAYAKHHGADDLAGLREKARAELEADAARLADESLDDELVGELIRRSTIEFPQQLVDRRRAATMSERLKTLQERGLGLERYLQAAKTNLQALEANDEAEAREYIIRQLALAELAKTANIEVDDADVERETAQLADRIGLPVEGFLQMIDRSEEQARIRDRAFAAKLLAHLRGQATIEDVVE